MPKVWCAEAAFSLKSMVQSRREHGIGARASFIDIIKARDRIKHEVISSALRKIGAPERHTRWVEKSCGDFEVILKIGKEDVAIPCGCGIWQGDNLAPTLLIIVVQLVSEDIIDDLKAANTYLPAIVRNPTGQGITRLHREDSMSELVPMIIFIFTHVDDRSASFNNEKDLINGYEMICRMMEKWGLMAHVGPNGKNLQRLSHLNR